jgi:hypothetical protein
MGARSRGPDIKAGAAKFRTDKAAREEAEAIVDRWNRRLATNRDMLWSPTIRAAILAGAPWLDVFCPGCGTSRAIDLRTLDLGPPIDRQATCGWRASFRKACSMEYAVTAAFLLSVVAGSFAAVILGGYGVRRFG